MVSHAEFYHAYQSTIMKLNKMFSRAQNCKEAAAQFKELQNRFKLEELDMYAAFCCLAVGRCEEAIGNTLVASSEYSFVGNTFLKLELDRQQSLAPGFREHILEATRCYLMAIECYRENGLFYMSGSLFLELGLALMSMNEFEGATLYIRRAAEMIQGDSTLMAVQCLNFVLDCELEQGFLFEASCTASTICKLVTGQQSSKSRKNQKCAFSQQEIRESLFVLICLLLLTNQQEKAKTFINSKMFNDYNYSMSNSLLESYSSSFALSPTPSIIVTPNPSNTTTTIQIPTPTGTTPKQNPKNLPGTTPTPTSTTRSFSLSPISGSPNSSFSIRKDAPHIFEHFKKHGFLALLTCDYTYTQITQNTLENVTTNHWFFDLSEIFLVACLENDSAAIMESSDELKRHLTSSVQQNVVQMLIEKLCY